MKWTLAWRRRTGSGNTASGTARLLTLTSGSGAEPGSGGVLMFARADDGCRKRRMRLADTRMAPSGGGALRPRRAPTSVRTQAPEAGRSASAIRPRVVVADDDGRFLEGMACLLMDRGAVVRKVADPADIIPTLASFRPHVLILDVWFARKRVGIESIISDVAVNRPEVRVLVAAPDPDCHALRIRHARVWGAVGVLDKRTVLAGDVLWRAVSRWTPR